MSEQFQIPDSDEEAIRELRGSGALLTAREWGWAAIVYALCRPHVRAGRPRRQENSVRSGNNSFGQLEDVGIYGLRSPSSVTARWNNWRYAG